MYSSIFVGSIESITFFRCIVFEEGKRSEIEEGRGVVVEIGIIREETITKITDDEMRTDDMSIEIIITATFHLYCHCEGS